MRRLERAGAFILAKTTMGEFAQRFVGSAAVTSLVGLRPTLPLVSRFGMLPANPTQDTMGPITRTVADAARVLDVITGYDANDPVTAYAVGNVPLTYTTALKVDALRGARTRPNSGRCGRSLNRRSPTFARRAQYSSTR